MRRGGTVLILAAAAFFALLGFGNLLVIKEAEDLLAHGEPADGTLVAHHGRRKSSLREYTYTYRAGGKEYTAERRDIPWSARELPIGTRLEVRYDPEDPDRSVTPAELEEMGKVMNRAFFFLLAGGFVAWAAARVLRRPAATSG